MSKTPAKCTCASCNPAEVNPPKESDIKKTPRKFMKNSDIRQMRKSQNQSQNDFDDKDEPRQYDSDSEDDFKPVPSKDKLLVKIPVVDDSSVEEPDKFKKPIGKPYKKTESEISDSDEEQVKKPVGEPVSWASNFDDKPVKLPSDEEMKKYLESTGVTINNDGVHIGSGHAVSGTKNEIVCQPDTNFSKDQITVIDYRLNEEMKKISEFKIINKLFGLFHPKIKIYLFGGAVRDIIQGIPPTDYDIIIVSNSSIRARMFTYINSNFGGDLTITRGGYKGTMIHAPNHVLVKLPGIDLVFIDSLDQMKYDFDVNTFYVQFDDQKKSYDWNDVITQNGVKSQIVKHIIEKKMIPMNKIDVVMKSNDKHLNLEHQLFRICKMYYKGFVSVHSYAFINFFEMYEQYKIRSKDRIVTEEILAKRKFIEDVCPMIFEKMRTSFD